MKPSDGTVCRVRDGRDDELARQLDFVARRDRLQFARQPAAIELGELPQDFLHRLDRFGRHVNHGRRHFHHPPAGDVHRQRHDVVQVAVRDEPRFGAHERPRLGAEIEAQLQLGEPPVGLHGGARIAFDRQVAVFERLDREIVDHRGRKDAAAKRTVRGVGAAIVEAERLRDKSRASSVGEIEPREHCNLLSTVNPQLSTFRCS